MFDITLSDSEGYQRLIKSYIRNARADGKHFLLGAGSFYIGQKAPLSSMNDALEQVETAFEASLGSTSPKEDGVGIEVGEKVLFSYKIMATTYELKPNLKDVEPITGAYFTTTVMGSTVMGSKPVKDGAGQDLEWVETSVLNPMFIATPTLRGYDPSRLIGVALENQDEVNKEILATDTVSLGIGTVMKEFFSRPGFYEKYFGAINGSLVPSHVSSALESVIEEYFLQQDSKAGEPFLKRAVNAAILREGLLGGLMVLPEPLTMTYLEEGDKKIPYDDKFDLDTYYSPENYKALNDAFEARWKNGARVDFSASEDSLKAKGTLTWTGGQKASSKENSK